MTPEQLTWTDEQWAVHLGCAAQQVPQKHQRGAQNHRQYNNKRYEKRPLGRLFFV